MRNGSWCTLEFADVILVLCCEQLGQYNVDC